MRGIRGRLVLAMVAVAAVTALLALPATMVYFERRLPPQTAALVEQQLRGGDFDGAFELGLLIALTASIGATIGALLARRIARPLSALSATARKVAGGDLTARPDVSRRRLAGHDETAGLLRDFTAMAEALQDLETERQASAAAIAHDLRTPLAVLQSRLEAARDGLLHVDPAEVETLLHQTVVLSRLVNDLRTLTLADAGRLTLHRRDTDLVALIERTAAAFALQAQARQVRLEVVVPDRDRRDGLHLHADPDRLAQALGNIVDNALRHTPAGGHVQLRARGGEHGATIEVRDTGPGFPATDLPRVFGRFYRADASRSRHPGQHHGSGLGLAIVKTIVDLHHGSVNAANTGTAGAQITIHLPDSAPPASPPQPATRPPRAVGGLLG